MTTKYLKTTMLAERWGINIKTLERWRWQGTGPKFLKIGGKVLYREEDVDAYEESRVREITEKDQGIPIEA
jgi:predicted site-specific integrase-resolvase